MSFSWSYAFQFLELLPGAIGTVFLAVMATISLAIVQAIALALMRLSSSRPIRWVATCWIELIRGTPALLQVYYVYFVAPSLGLTLSAFASGVLALSANYGAYLAEVFRAGILAVPQGQREAGEALGLNYIQLQRLVVLPQAVRRIIPTIGNYFVLLVKDTSLLSTITVPEIMLTSYEQASITFRYFEIFTIAGVVYFVLSYPSAKGVEWLERRFDVRRVSRTKRFTGRLAGRRDEGAVL